MGLLYVVDVGDDCVVFVGSLDDCVRVLDVSAGNLMVLGYWELSAGMVRSLSLLEWQDN